MDDNVYPATSERFISVPDKQKKKQEKEREEYLAEKPIVAAVLDDLNEQVEFLDSIRSITETKDTEEFMRQVRVNQMVSQALRQQIRRLEVKIKAFDKK